MNAKMLKVCGYMATKQMTVPFAKDRKRWPALRVVKEMIAFLRLKNEDIALERLEWTLSRLAIEIDIIKRLENIREASDFESACPIVCTFCSGKGVRCRKTWPNELFCPWCNAKCHLTKTDIDNILPKQRPSRRKPREKVESKKISAPMPK